MGAVSYVNEANKPISSMPAEVISGDIEILRGDLARILHDATRHEAEYIFGDSITVIAQDDEGVTVNFERAPARTFDLVVGADGLHSNVRALAFGDESRFIHHLGYYLAIFTTANHLDLDHTGRFYSVPGKLAGIYSARENTEAKAMLYFVSPPLDYDHRDLEQQKQLVADAFGDEAWEVPRLLEAMRKAPDFYFDSVSQIHMDGWSRGRTVLLGDAAYSASPLSGMGSGLAMVGAYVLAGELKAAAGEYRPAFARYEERMRGYVVQGQKSALGAGKWFVPASRARIWIRNQNFRLLPHMPWKGLIANTPRKTANAITLTDYRV